MLNSSTEASTDNPKSDFRELASKRLASIDVYRGMVMFLMLAEMLRLEELHKITADGGWLSKVFGWISFHTSHVEWHGCSLHDMIQPSFTFLVGTAMVFSLAHRGSKGQSWGGMFCHVLLRSLTLVFLGIFLRSLGKPMTNFTFDDTLTQIGLGYWILFLLSGLSMRNLLIGLGVIVIGYWIAFVAYPLPSPDFSYASVGVASTWSEHDTGLAAHFNKNSNLAWAADRWWMNLFPRESPFLFSAGGYATLSFIPTLGTMLLGLIAGRILQQDLTVGRKQILLWTAAVVCMLAAVAINALGVCPIVKRIWTPTWVLWSGGICFVWLASLNLICDIGGFKRWGFLFLVIGSNSIVAYVMSWTLVEPIHQAIERHFGFAVNAFAKVLEAIIRQFASLDDSAIVREFAMGTMTMCVVWLILWWLYNRKIFVKI